MKLKKFSFLKSDLKTFKFWFGYGSPFFLLLTLFVSYTYTDSRVFYGYIILSQLWWWESLYTTCSRCPNYGTSNCGLQGLMVEKLVPFNRSKLTIRRITQHKIFDIVYMVLSVVICWKYVTSGLFATIWMLGALKISLQPKKFHGLLYQTK